MLIKKGGICRLISPERFNEYKDRGYEEIKEKPKDKPKEKQKK